MSAKEKDASTAEQAIRLMENIIPLRVEVKTERSQLQTKERQLRQYEAELHALLGSNGSRRSTKEPAKELTWRDQILPLLSADKDTSSDDLMKLLGVTDDAKKRASIFAALSRMKKSKEIDRGTRHGTYRLRASAAGATM